MEVLSDMPRDFSPDVVVSGGPDDAGVYRLDEERLMVQSVDFFTPIVDDPHAYGCIAAANSLSDLYAMGARPATALNVVGVPLEEVGMERLKTILRGENETMAEAGGAIIGGHTVKNPEPVVGLAVTGFVHEDRMVRNGPPEPNDRLILTKPLGTGIVTTAHQSGEVDGIVLAEAINWMRRLNDVGPELAEEGLVRCMTDITGYGLVGHALEMVRDRLGIRFRLDDLPLLPGVRDLAEEGYVPGGTRDNWEAVRDRVQVNAGDELAPWIVADAQTSGGLLLAVDPDRVEPVVDRLRDEQLCHETIGTIQPEPPVVIDE